MKIYGGSATVVNSLTGDTCSYKKDTSYNVTPHQKPGGKSVSSR
jgi:hypothetical protein